jgi:cargo-transport protein YPP1
MRHLIHALEGSENYVEAERSLDAYLLIVKNEKKTLARIQNSNTPPVNVQGVVQDIDSDEDILRTMAAGIRILVKYQNKGKKALEVALKLERYAKSWNIEDPKIHGVVWHAIGLANSLWSMQSKHFPYLMFLTCSD